METFFHAKHSHGFVHAEPFLIQTTGFSQAVILETEIVVRKHTYFRIFTAIFEMNQMHVFRRVLFFSTKNYLKPPGRGNQLLG